MKNRWESAETFQKFAELEILDYMLRQEKKNLDSKRAASPIDQMIDEATGFGVAKDLESIDNIVANVRRQIVLRKELEIDDSSVSAFLRELLKLQKSLKADIQNLALKHAG